MISGFIVYGISSIVTAVAIASLRHEAQENLESWINDIFAEAERNNSYDSWVYASDLLRREELAIKALEALDRARLCDQD
jgi:hypothetical protein